LYIENMETVAMKRSDQLEWLTLEALWSTARYPFPDQWERWLAYEAGDPGSVPASVVRANIIQANQDINAAFDKGDDAAERAQLLGHAAGSFGKMAAGLIGVTVHFSLPSERWEQPISKLVMPHADVVRRLLDINPVYSTDFLVRRDVNSYYERLMPVANIVRAMGPRPDSRALCNQSKDVFLVAKMAVRSWLDFMNEYPGLQLLPGGTPRTINEQTDQLQEELRACYPTVHRAAA
jgi:hypothetical protein